MKHRKQYAVTALAVAAILCLLILFKIMVTMKISREKVILPSINDVPADYWETLSRKKIFFGHKSVGYNIIKGIHDIMQEYPQINLDIIETKQADDFSSPIFAHAPVGKNTRPLSKISGFEKIMDGGIGHKVDIAFFKLCYIDIMHNSDPEEIFNDYSRTMAKLKTSYPKTKFLYVTTPIRSRPQRAKGKLKEPIKILIGRPTVLDDNAKRQQYNTLLKKAYSGSEPLFDLAQAEYVDSEGFKLYAVKNKERIFFMHPQYTYDGGHLNELGRKRVAEQLLITLAEMTNGQ